MTPQELLIPRVLAIGTEPGTPNYPDSLFTSGEVLILWNKYYYKQADGISICTDRKVSKSVVDEYPSLFRPLEWWEHRTPEQMPLYLKHGENGKVRKVKEYSTGEVLTIAVFEGGRVRRLTNEWIPCTEQDYMEYQISKQ